MKMKLITIVILGVLFFPVFLYSDRIELKNGKVLNGTVNSQENNVVNLITATGEKIQIKKEDIATMIYAEPIVIKKKPANVVSPTPKETQPVKQPQPTTKSTEISGQKIQLNNNEKLVEKTEKVIVDKELTNSVMQKFEDADKRRQQATNSEIEVLKAELEYLKKEKERMQRQNQGDEDFKKTMDKRMAGLEIRIRRLEKYLGMDETMVDYYQRQRSPWDLVWRSAIFPGWGHRYAREDYTGNAYSTSILVLGIIHYFIAYQANAAEDVAKIALFNGTVVRTVQYSSLGIPSSYSNSFVMTSIASYSTAMSAVDSQKQLADNFLNIAVGLYVIQLVHAYFTGVEWAKVQPRDYSNEGLLKPTGFNMKTKSDNNFQARVPERGFRYELEYTKRF